MAAVLLDVWEIVSSPIAPSFLPPALAPSALYLVYSLPSSVYVLRRYGFIHTSILCDPYIPPLGTWEYSA